MITEEAVSRQELREFTAEIVAAYVSNNSVHRDELRSIISSVHTALSTLGSAVPQPAAERPAPPVSVRKSVTPDYLISMEDGRPYKSLKRHLNVRGLSPTEYRKKWSLPHDYPMTAPNYAAHRSQLAKAIGLGRKRTEPAPAKRGRRRHAA